MLVASVGTSVLERIQRLAAPLEDVFAFFADPQNLAAITPAWLHFRIVAAPGAVERGTLIAYRLRLKGVPVRWLTEIVDWQPPRSFTDVQLVGPYRVWQHTHRLTPLGRGETEMYDHVLYAVPGGPLSPLVERPARTLLDEIFDYRARRISEVFAPTAREQPEPLLR
jgi:ligand-binding SRPBCC domain-containing protein